MEIKVSGYILFALLQLNLHLYFSNLIVSVCSYAVTVCISITLHRLWCVSDCLSCVIMLSFIFMRVCVIPCSLHMCADVSFASVAIAKHKLVCICTQLSWLNWPRRGTSWMEGEGAIMDCHCKQVIMELSELYTMFHCCSVLDQSVCTLCRQRNVNFIQIFMVISLTTKLRIH